MQKKFQTPYNDIKRNDIKEKKTNKPSMTIPDQTLSIRTIVERYTKGLKSDVAINVPQYHGDVYVPDMERLDLAEREELLETAKQNTKNIQKKLQEQKKSEEKEQTKKELEQLELDLEKDKKNKPSEKPKNGSEGTDPKEAKQGG